ncbi:MAG: aspartyl protease family protein [Deltaproteobacteria bacterium]
MRRLLQLLGVLALVAGAAAVGYYARPPVPAAPPTYDDASDAVHAAPRDPEAWIALGDAQSNLDEIAAAEHAYRTALRLDPNHADAYARLGFLLFGQGEDAEARRLLAEAKRRGAAAPMLDSALAQLTERPAEAEWAPPAEVEAAPTAGGEALDAGVTLDASTYAESPEAGSDSGPGPEPGPGPGPGEESGPGPEPGPGPGEALGPCDIALTRLPNSRALGIDVTVGGVESRLLFDTGATMTVVTTEIANLMRLQRDPSRRIVARTANGRVVMESGVVDFVHLAGRDVAGTRVAVCEDCTQGVADGLFGLDLVAAFGLTVDPTRRVATFDDCR